MFIKLRKKEASISDCREMSMFPRFPIEHANHALYLISIQYVDR